MAAWRYVAPARGRSSRGWPGDQAAPRPQPFGLRPADIRELVDLPIARRSDAWLVPCRLPVATIGAVGAWAPGCLLERLVPLASADALAGRTSAVLLSSQVPAASGLVVGLRLLSITLATTKAMRAATQISTNSHSKTCKRWPDGAQLRVPFTVTEVRPTSRSIGQQGQERNDPLRVGARSRTSGSSQRSSPSRGTGRVWTLPIHEPSPTYQCKGGPLCTPVAATHPSNLRRVPRPHAAHRRRQWCCVNEPRPTSRSTPGAPRTRTPAE
jgi:hypothetical protein